jgi:lysophospholipase
MELIAIDGNPIPDGAVVGTVIAADGVRTRYARWRASARPVLGTVCLLQGLGEAIEKYFETIEDLRKRGFAVAALDWRGQGGSDRRLRDATKAHVDSFAEYDRDLEAFVQQVVLPDCAPPYFALAHSLGGLVALRAAHEGRTSFARMVLSAPLVGFGRVRPSEPLARRLAPTMTAIGLGELSVPGQAKATMASISFDDNPLTGDAARFARNQALAVQLPQLFVGAPTFGWFHAAFGAIGEAQDPDFAAAIRIPTLVAVGALDQVVSIIAVERFVGDMRAGGKVIIAGARHELLMERDRIREQFLAAFDAFIPGS